MHEGWELLYAEARSDLVDSPVLDDVNDAAEFVRQIIGQATATPRRSSRSQIAEEEFELAAQLDDAPAESA